MSRDKDAVLTIVKRIRGRAMTRRLEELLGSRMLPDPDIAALCSHRPAPPEGSQRPRDLSGLGGHPVDSEMAAAPRKHNARKIKTRDGWRWERGHK